MVMTLLLMLAFALGVVIHVVPRLTRPAPALDVLSTVPTMSPEQLDRLVSGLRHELALVSERIQDPPTALPPTGPFLPDHAHTAHLN